MHTKINNITVCGVYISCFMIIYGCLIVCLCTITGQKIEECFNFALLMLKINWNAKFFAHMKTYWSLRSLRLSNN